MDVIRIALIGQRALVREVLAACLRKQDGFQVAWTAECSTGAGPKLLEDVPDILLVDVEKQSQSSLDLVCRMIAGERSTRVVILSNPNGDESASLSLIPSGQIARDDSFETLVSVIRQVASGLDPGSERTRGLSRVDHVDPNVEPPHPHALPQLTAHQLQILKHLANGASAKEIAKRVHISVRAVNSIKYRIMSRLGIHDRVQLARFAIREGLVSP